MNTGSLAPRLRDLGGLSRLEREFDLVRRLEFAGPGEHWLATRGDDHQHALLRIVPRESVNAQQAAALERDLARASQLAPHPHLASVLGADVLDDRFVVATAQAEGDDLCSLVRQTGALPLDAAVDCCQQALQGLQHAHEHGIAHGQLALTDCVLDYDGVLKIGNWGCAALADPCDFSAAIANDLRSVAAIVRHLLTAPDPGTRDLAADGDPGAKGQEIDGPSEALSAFLRRLDAAGTPQGFASAREARIALEHARLEQPSPPADERERRPGDGLCAACRGDGSAPVAEREPAAACCAAESERSVAALESRYNLPAAPAGAAAAGAGRTAWRLCGAVLAMIAMLAAVVGYLVWH